MSWSQKTLGERRPLLSCSREQEGKSPRGTKNPRGFSPDSYPHFTNQFCERAWQGDSYCSDQQNLCFVDPLVKVLLKDVGKNQAFRRGSLTLCTKEVTYLNMYTYR